MGDTCKGLECNGHYDFECNTCKGFGNVTSNYFQNPAPDLKTFSPCRWDYVQDFEVNYHAKSCSECNGIGRAERTRRDGTGVIKLRFCDACIGTGGIGDMRIDQT